MASKRILITSGPTAVAVDDVRVITNRSTGDMGRLLAAELTGKGCRVTILEGAGATTRLPLGKTTTLKKFFYYDEFAALLAQELRRGHDAVIHAAAVSDFRLKRPFQGKLVSGKPLKLILIPTKKLIDRIKKDAPGIFLVGFKLETRLGGKFIIDRIKGLFGEARCDLAVANRQVGKRYEACLVWPSGRISGKVFSKKAIAAMVAREVVGSS